MTLDVIIPWGGEVDDPWRTRSFWWLRQRYRRLLPSAHLVIGTSRAEPFNRSEARNNAFRHSDADVILVADADTIFHVDAIREAVAFVEAGVPWVIPYSLGRYYNLAQHATEKVQASDPAGEVPEPSDPDEWEHKLNSTAGLLVLPRTAWLKVGGYDETFTGWGYEDDAFRAALDRLVGKHRRVDGYALHLWHDAPEETRFGQPSIEDNRRRFKQYERGLLP